jgi:uncharacterized protein YjbJ (UPF0337 family)
MARRLQPCRRAAILLERSVNKDHVKGAAKEIGGKIQQQAGKLTGNKSQQVKGAAHQAEGKVQKGVGDVKDAARDAAHEAEKKSDHH